MGMEQKHKRNSDDKSHVPETKRDENAAALKKKTDFSNNTKISRVLVDHKLFMKGYEVIAKMLMLMKSLNYIK